MAQSSENNIDAMMIDPPSVPSRDPRKVDDSVLETMPPHQRHNFVRKRAYLQEAKARRAARKLEKRHQPSERKSSFVLYLLGVSSYHKPGIFQHTF